MKTGPPPPAAPRSTPRWGQPSPGSLPETPTALSIGSRGSRPTSASPARSCRRWRRARPSKASSRVAPTSSRRGRRGPGRGPGEPLESQLAGVHYLFLEGAEVTEAVLARAPDLRLVQKHGEDCRNIDLGAAARRGVPVATLRRWVHTSVAGHT